MYTIPMYTRITRITKINVYNTNAYKNYEDYYMYTIPMHTRIITYMYHVYGQYIVNSLEISLGMQECVCYAQVSFYLH